MTMRIALAVTAALLMVPGLAHAQAKADPAHVYGPDPGWEHYRELAEQAVIARLIDPESARITWLSGYRKGGFKPMLQGRVHGYVACGTVNARNRMGGYAGATTFIVVVDFDRALHVEMDARAGGMAAEACEKQIAQGLFPPVPSTSGGSTRALAAGAGPPADDADRAGVVGGSASPSPAGLTVRAMPDGAYVAAVEPSSSASAAGLALGMVITSVNGIPLAGMGDAMIKVMAAARAGATLTLVGGKTVTLGAPR